MKKVLIVLGDENYILYTNSSRPEHLYEAIKKKRELYKVLSSDRKGHEFLIFDRDFNTYVHMDSDTQIEHLSRVLIRPKTADGHHKDGHQKSAAHHKTPHQSTRSERNQSESIVVSVNPSDLNNQQSNSSSISQINQLIGQLGAQVGSQTANQSTSQLNNPTSSQTSSQTNSHLINQLNSPTNGHQRNSQMQFDLFNLPKSQSSSLTLKSDPIASLNSLAAGSVASTSNLMTNASAYLQADQSETFEDEASNGQSFENGGNIDIEWPEDDVAALIECCQQFAQNFTYYNVSIDLVYLDQQTDDELWEQIAAKVRRCTSKSYKKAQCRSKFLELRTKYINVKAYTGLENSYFCQQKYFHNLEQLIDGVKPSVDLLQLNGQLKARHREHGKNGFKDKNSYLSLIAQVKAFARQFNENIVSKNSIWKEIANNLNQEGFRFTGKSCQGLFHRLRYSYLHLLKTIASEEEGQEKWPYFQAFSGIDLTPFTSKRRSRGLKFGPREDDDRGDEEELEDESNDHSNDPEFESFDVDNLHDNFSFDQFANPMKRMKSS